MNVRTHLLKTFFWRSVAVAALDALSEDCSALSSASVELASFTLRSSHHRQIQHRDVDFIDGRTSFGVEVRLPHSLDIDHPGIDVWLVPRQSYAIFPIPLWQYRSCARR